MAYIGFNPSQLAIAPFAQDSYVGNGVTTTFTLSQAVPGANEANVEVFVENVQQRPIDSYTIGGALNNQLIFSEAPPSGAEIYVIFKGEATYNLQPATGSVTALSLDPVLRNFRVDTFAGNGSQTQFTLTDTPYSANSILVTVDGIVQTAGVNYTVSGTTLDFGTTAPSEAPDSAANISVVHLGFSTGNKSVMDGSINPIKLSTGGPTWSTAGVFSVSNQIGVGTTTPSQKLETVGNIKINGASNANVANLIMTRTDTSWRVANETDFRLYYSNSNTDNPSTLLINATSNGRVGIGTASPSLTLQVSGSSASMGVSGSTTSQLYITNSFAGSSSWRFINPDNTFGTPLGSLGLWNDTTQNYPIQFLSTGTVVLPMGQLRFPATQNSSSDPNTLDDYEEGTWTPVPTFGGSNVGMSYSSAGTYIKIGRMVFVNASFNFTANGSSTGIFRLTGLPFPANTNAAGVYFGDGIVFTGASLLAVVESGIPNTITMAKQDGGTGSLGGWAYLDHGSTSGAGGKRVCVWYEAVS